MMSGEFHHIIPKSIDPSLVKFPLNIVRLTYREHYVAHLLLTKLYPDGREHWNMVNALHRMCNSKNGLIVSSHEFEYAKHLWAITPEPEDVKKRRIEATLKAKEGKHYSNPHTKEWNQKISKANSGKNRGYWWTNGVENVHAYECPSEGWHRGRTFTQEHIESIRNTDHSKRKGCKLSEEQKHKISENKKKFYAEHPEAIETLRLINLGRKHSLEARKHMSDSHKKIITGGKI